MLFRTHITLGFLTGLFFVNLLSPSNKILFMALAIFGSIFPDVDNPTSKIGRLIPLGHFFKHRGIVHSLFTMAFLSLILSLFTDHFYAFSLGFTAHLIVDSLTPMGIGFFYPFTSFRIRGFMRTGSIFDHIIFAAILISSAMLLI